MLRPGGTFVVANLSFITASTGWERDAEGKRLFRRVDNYAEEHSEVYEWARIKIRNWHRPLSAYMDAYLESGLLLREFLEPVPESDAWKDNPRLEDWYRVPEFTAMKWQKPER